MVFSTAINLLHAAKKAGIGILLNDDQLRIKIPKGRKVDPGFLEEIRHNKEGIIGLLKDEKWKSTRIDSQARIPVMPTGKRPSRMPLSYSQERLWFLDQREGSTQYHVPSILRFRGDLDRTALEYAFRQIVNRHEILRTVIGEEQGRPFQQVLEKDGWTLPVIDDPAYRQDPVALSSFIEQLISEPFDLSKDHQLRAHLIRLGGNEHVLVATMHHIASDGWSGSILVKEFGELYTAFRGGRAARLEPLPVQYGDYAIWQREQLSGAIFDGKVAYWRTKLDGVAMLNLPTDHGRPATQSIAGGRISQSFGKDLTDRLMALSHEEGATLYMTLLCVFKILLYRYSGQEDICIGSSIAGRQQAEVEGLIGFFANTLALRSELRSTMSARQLLGQVKQTTLEAYEHQEVPFEKVVEILGLKRSGSSNPVFQVMFVLENVPEAGRMDLGNMGLMAENFGQISSKFDLTLSISQTAGGIQVNITYRSSLYEPGTIERMLGHYEQLLQSVVKAPDCRVDGLTILPLRERQLLLGDLHTSQVAYPKDKTVVDLFVEQANRTPEEIAVVFEEETISYRELDERSNQLANHLCEKGILPGSLVGLFLDRSWEAIVGLMGILKAGGAYIPIDPAFPNARIRYMLEDTGCPLLVTGGEQLERLRGILSDNGEGESLPKIVVVGLNDGGNEREDERAVIARQKKSLPKTGLTAGHLAYVIYTSGTTGTSKGVMIEHRNLVDYVYGLEARVGIGQCNSFALVSTLSADLGNTVVYSALLSGGTLHVLPGKVVMDAEEMTGYFKRNKIDCLKIVPSHWKALCHEDRLLLPRQLLVFGGEALPEESVSLIRSAGSGCRIVNHYGPTETTIGKLLYETGPGENRLTVPIGKPFSNTQVYVVNQALELCPVGIPGELYIGGDGVGRGYLNRPELSATRFIVNPFRDTDGRKEPAGSNVSGSCLYRTGDLVRWLPDGQITFLGRIDNQVKIRGYRVELGEIGAMLSGCQGVRESVVVLREGAAGARQLVGYIVPEGSFDREGIMTSLKARLPEYMLPGWLVQMEALPLTANGKIDRQALPDPDTGNLHDDGYVAPRNEREQQLALVWQELLAIDRIGVNDNFFELGGHSLLAIRLISAIRKQLGIEVSIGDIFDYPSIGLLAGQLIDSSGKELLVPITMPERPPVLPLSYSQERLWFLDQLEGSQSYHIPVVLRLKGALNEDALTFALRSIVNRHEVLRTVILTDQGIASQRILEKNGWNLETTDQTQYKEDTEALRSFISTLINQPFDLSADHKLRARLIRLSPSESVLVMVLHHIASDGWSNAILVNEFFEFYESRITGRNDRLLPLPVQYADFALWQRQYLTGEVLERQLAYWRKKLAGIIPLTLATDYIRPSVQGTRGNALPFKIEKELLEKLQAFSLKEGTTLFMCLLAGFKVLLYRYSGQGDIAVGSPIAGRQQAEVEGLIGSFINTLVFRSDLDGNPDFLRLLQQVKLTTLGAYENQEAPFEKVVEALVKEREMSRSPLFQVLFLLQQKDRGEIRTGSRGGLEIEWVPSGHTTSKFDLSLSLAESKDGLQGSIEYCTDLYKEETIRRMAGHFICLLSAIVADPSQRIGDLPMLNVEERLVLLEGFNNTGTAYSIDKTVADLFRERVKKIPYEVAVICEDLSLSYRELEDRSNQLANFLRRKGVQEEDLVVICLERSLEMIIGILGILKAGGAYVPVDPGFPAGRIRHMLEDSNAQVILTSSFCRSGLPAEETTGLQTRLIVELDGQWEEIAGETKVPPPGGPGPHHPAYVIYTSGSTGLPKGVITAHRGLTNRLLWAQNNHRLTRKDVVLQKTTYCFDVSVWELFWPLIAGARLVFARPGGHKDIGYLKETIASRKITTIHFVPPFLSLFLPEVRPGECKSLKKVLCSGEALKRSQVNLFRERLPNAVLYNLYGPTEASIEVTSWVMPWKDERNSLVPIGKPIANTALYILDRDRNPVPVGGVGELFIAGVPVARGYLNLPELTFDRFVPDPFSPDAGSRMYRTGDLCQWLPDGNIIYLGRIDDQVKIRGYRVEPGEIESVMLQSGMISQATVLARIEPGGNKRLVGYFVANGPTDGDDIVHFLKARLPEYMLPVLVEIREMPLTNGGKVDRKSLPDPDSRQLRQGKYVAPRSELEKKLTRIWEELLDIEQVGVNDNFFGLGGHSMLGLRLVALIRKTLSIDAAIGDVFGHPTIEEMAAKWGEKSQSDTGRVMGNKTTGNPHLVLLQESPYDLPVFLIPGAGGRSDAFQQLAEALGDRYTVYGLHMRGTEKKGKPLNTIREVAAQNIKWIREIQPNGPYRLIGHCFGANIAYEMALQLERKGQVIDFVAVLDGIAGVKRAVSAEFNETVFIMQMIADYFDSFEIIKAPYPDWVNELKQHLSELPLKAMMPFVAGFVKEKIPEKKKTIEFLSRLINVRIFNTQMHYSPPGKIRGELLIMKAEQTNMPEREEMLGWAGFAEHLKLRMVPGDHDTMINKENSAIIARHIKDRFNHG